MPNILCTCLLTGHSVVFPFFHFSEGGKWLSYCTLSIPIPMLQQPPRRLILSDKAICCFLSYCLLSSLTSRMMPTLSSLIRFWYARQMLQQECTEWITLSKESCSRNSLQSFEHGAQSAPLSDVSLLRKLGLLTTISATHGFTLSTATSLEPTEAVLPFRSRQKPYEESTSLWTYHKQVPA